MSALALLGCAAGPFRQLAKDDRDLFFRCWPSMQAPLCGAGSAVYQDICENDAQKKYANRPAAKRGKWLVASGCPQGMVAASEDERDEGDER